MCPFLATPYLPHSALIDHLLSFPTLEFDPFSALYYRNFGFTSLSIILEAADSEPFVSPTSPIT
jgi:hypothetical protein